MTPLCVAVQTKQNVPYFMGHREAKRGIPGRAQTKPSERDGIAGATFHRGASDVDARRFNLTPRETCG
ncbi:unnamed protein product [Lampetra fluviatilis]